MRSRIGWWLGIACALASASAQAFTPGSLLIVEPGAGIRVWTPGAATSTLVIAGPPLADPRAVAIEANGNAIVADRNAGTFRYSPTGALLGNVGIWGIDVAISSNGAIWILTDGGQIFLAPSILVAGPIPDARGIAIARGPSGEDVVVVTSGANGGQILRIPPSGTPVVIGSGFPYVARPGTDRFGNLLVPQLGSLYAIDPVTGAVRGSFAAGSLDPQDAVATSADRYFVADGDAGGNCRILEVDPLSNTTTLVGVAPVCGSTPRGIAAMPGGTPAPKLATGDLVIADSGAFGGGGALVRIHPSTGATRALALGTGPHAVEVSATREIAAVAAANVDRFDPVTGRRQALTILPPPSLIRGAAFEKNGDLLLSVEEEPAIEGRLVRVARTTGAPTTLATIDGDWYDPGCLIVDPCVASPLALAIPRRALAGAFMQGRGLLSFSAQVFGLGTGPFELSPGAPLVAGSGFVGGGFFDGHLAIAPDGSTAYTANTNALSKTPMPPASGLAPFASGGMLVSIGGMDVEDSGDVVVADRSAFGGGGGVIRVNASSATQTRVTTAAFVDPQSIAVVPPASCGDGLDNDDDGQTDFPADTGCTSANDPWETADCSDGIDNDMDGTIDYDPEGDGDPGCSSLQFGIEDAQCSNGADDDGDGRVDGNDAQCTGASDNRESPQPACGLLGIEVVLVGAWATSRRARRRH
jgi:hypothetical protein